MHHLEAALLLFLTLLVAGGCDRDPGAADALSPVATGATAAAGSASSPSRANPPAAAAPRARDPWLDDGRPQSGLPRMKLYLGARELNAELAITPAAIQKGLMWRTNIADTDAMLFVFGRPHQTAFYMRNVPMDIDVAYLDPEGVILEIHRLERFNTNPVPSSSSRIQFVLETAEGWFNRHGISTGTVVRTERGTLRETFLRR